MKKYKDIFIYFNKAITNDKNSSYKDFEDIMLGLIFHLKDKKSYFWNEDFKNKYLNEVKDDISAIYKCFYGSKNIDKDLLKIIHYYVYKWDWDFGDDDISFKQCNNKVKGYPQTTRYYNTESSLTKILDLFNNDYNSNKLFKIFRLYQQLLIIHPFRNGNGRMAFTLLLLLLMDNNYCLINYVDFIKNRRMLWNQDNNDFIKLNNKKHNSLLDNVIFFLNLYAKLINKKMTK